MTQALELGGKIRMLASSDFKSKTVRQLRHVRSLYRRRSDLHSLELGIVGK
jgi:hypothetical protein